MNIEKLVNSRIYRFFDWLWRLAMLNILTLVTCLGIITIIPSFSACYKTIQNYGEGNDQNVFILYFKNFKQYFKKSYLASIFVLLISGVLFIAIQFYSKNAQIDGMIKTIAIIGFYFVLFLSIMMIIVIIQLPLVYTNFNFKFFDNFKFSFYISFRYILFSVIYLLSFALFALLYVYFLPGWLITCISFPLFVAYNLFNKIYWRLNNQPNEEGEENV